MTNETDHRDLLADCMDAFGWTEDQALNVIDMACEAVSCTRDELPPIVASIDRSADMHRLSGLMVLASITRLGRSLNGAAILILAGSRALHRYSDADVTDALALLHTATRPDEQTRH